MDRTSRPHFTHYLDDFLLAGLGDSPICWECLEAFKTMAAELGFPLAEEKTQPPG